MLAGYAVVTSSGWGIIAQRPTAVTLEPIQELIWALLGYAAPLAIAFLLAIWWCARMISRRSRSWRPMWNITMWPSPCNASGR